MVSNLVREKTIGIKKSVILIFVNRHTEGCTRTSEPVNLITWDVEVEVGRESIHGIVSFGENQQG